MKCKVMGVALLVGCLVADSCVAAEASPAFVTPKLPTSGICAHRGDRASCPENTVPAFLSAVSNGAAMVEFDVHRCKTGCWRGALTFRSRTT